MSSSIALNQTVNDQLLSLLQGASDQTRLRLLMLMKDREFTVKDLTFILDQSQPRLSRHLKLLVDAGFLERYQEGSWVYFRQKSDGFCCPLARVIFQMASQDKPPFKQDWRRAEQLISDQAKEAQNYFKEHASQWDQIRSSHVPEALIEKNILAMIKGQSFDFLIDMGTGTGRILELLKDHFKTALGLDQNREMLSYARKRLNRLGIQNAQLRLGDVTDVNLDNETVDGVILHQVLHYLNNPGKAILEAGRLLREHGLLMVVDFKTHNLEHLRDDFAHTRLGFEKQQIETWFERAGLKLTQEKYLKGTGKEANSDLTIALWLGRKIAS